MHVVRLYAFGSLGLVSACFHDRPPADVVEATSGESSSGALTGSESSSSGSSSGESSGDTGATTCEPDLWYLDGDGDGHGDPQRSQLACAAPAEHVAVGDDCDDGDPMRAPGLDELCDDQDNDCDPLVDEHSPLNLECDDCTLLGGAGSSYALCAGAPSWADARIECQERGGDLAVIDDAEENAALTATLVMAGSYYIGVNDLALEGSFVWLDGAVTRYTAWAMGEPNDTMMSEDCGVLLATGVWNDQDCAQPTSFACEVAAAP